MSGTSGFRPPQLEGYNVETQTDARVASLDSAETSSEIRITLFGANFVTRAMPLVITIGNVTVTRYQIAPDEQSVTCFLDEMPEEGSIISVGYGGEERTELPERFSRSRL